MQKYATCNELNGFKEDMKEIQDSIVDNNQFSKMQKEMKIVQKNLKLQLSKEEFYLKLNQVYHEIKEKLKQRPLHADIKLMKTKTDEQLNKLNQNAQNQEKKVKLQFENLEKHVQNLGSEIDFAKKVCDEKMSLKDGQRLWRQHQRFAEYEDLRDLYKKCLPEILKFEQKLINYQGEIDRTHLIIRKFDEQMISKAEKNAVDKIYRYIDENFQTKRPE